MNYRANYLLFCNLIFQYLSWDWVNEWTLDTSGAYGEHDSDGWYYAGTFDGIAEMLKTKSGSAAAAKTSLVRKRRWVRSMRCTSVELTIQMNNRIQRVATMRKHVEAALLEKELSMKNVGFYEENRDFVFDQSLSLATRGTIATLATLKDLVVKLKRLSQVLLDINDNIYMVAFTNHIYTNNSLSLNVL